MSHRKKKTYATRVIQIAINDLNNGQFRPDGVVEQLSLA